jgi:glycosyltransferase involved in cell wall biosynthesis
MKNKLLFIAPRVPIFDKHSGDLRLFSILNILSKYYDITYLAKKRASDNTIENKRYVSVLRDLGINIHVENYSLRDIFHLNRFSAAILEFYHIAEHYLPRIKLLQPTCPVIVDTVDVHYLRCFRKYEINKDISDLRIAEDVKKRELDIYDQADIVLTVTEDDAISLQKEIKNLNTKIIPNIHCVVYPTNDQNRNEIIFVGGFKHDPNIDAVIYFCEEIFPRIRKIKPEARFTIVGSNPPENIRSLSNDFVTVTGYVPETTPYLQKSYISVAPLRYGAGMKGKVGEAMAHGIPVVSTSIGAEGMGLTDRENIMIADSPENFSKSVIELFFDQDLYKRIQKNSLDYIEKNYTKEIVGEKIKHIIEKLDNLPIKKLSFTKKAFFLFNYALTVSKGKLKILD